MKSIPTHDVQPFAMLGDHPVLEFLNTLPMVDGQLHDQLRTDADVLRTLARLGYPAAFEGRGLVAAARTLREEIRQLIERRKAGKSLDLARFNLFLSQADSHLTLHPDRKRAPALVRVWQNRTPQQALAPLAEAAADLLAHGDFTLVRACESDACVLWFYDRTRSHQRRWCSMATCGNRHKVASFRKRQAEA